MFFHKFVGADVMSWCRAKLNGHIIPCMARVRCARSPRRRPRWWPSSVTSGRHQRSKQGRLVIFPGFFTLFRGIFLSAKSILVLVKVLPENNSRTKNKPQKKRKTAHKYSFMSAYIYTFYLHGAFSLIIQLKLIIFLNIEEY